jgi:hypothetical protein
MLPFSNSETSLTESGLPFSAAIGVATTAPRISKIQH